MEEVGFEELEVRVWAPAGNVDARSAGQGFLTKLELPVTKLSAQNAGQR